MINPIEKISKPDFPYDFSDPVESQRKKKEKDDGQKESEFKDILADEISRIK